MVIVATLVIFVGSIGVPPCAAAVLPRFHLCRVRWSIWSCEGVSHGATDAVVRSRSLALLEKADGIENYVAYVGAGSPRFYFAAGSEARPDQLLQIRDSDHRLRSARKPVHPASSTTLPTMLPGVRRSSNGWRNGPPVGFPVQYRVSGPDFAKLREISHQVADRMREQSALSNVHLDWGGAVQGRPFAR